MTDDLETILGSHPMEAPAEGRRAELLAASTRILRRRVMIRRVSRVAAVVAVFALGGAAGWLVKPAQIEREFVYVTPEPAVLAPEPPRTEPPVLSPNELELKAELSDDKALVARLYREAGDKYLSEIRDYGQAARCYRLHLKAAEPAEQKVATNDSWLLISMKTLSQE
jgi:hypothetical protein